MNRFRLLAVATVLMVAMAAFAQQPATSAQQQTATAASPVDRHMQMLSERLSLTTEQQDRIRPILQRMFDGRQKLMADTSLSDEQRHEQMKALHDKADKQARQYLNDDQKKKLDELEAEHQQKHGD